MKEKFKELKKELKLWKGQVWDKAKITKQQFLKEIAALDEKGDDGNLQEEERMLRVHLLSELDTLNNREIAMVRQKARTDWMQKGDINSKFFHSRLRWRRLSNDLRGLYIRGVWS